MQENIVTIARQQARIAALDKELLNQPSGQMGYAL